MPAKPQPPLKSNDSVYELHVVLARSEPPIWRRLQVRGDTTLAKLHTILQVAMGWEDCHLHQFDISGEQYASRDSGLEDTADTSRARLNRVVPQTRMKFLYEYDFGDGWAHVITVKKIHPAGAVAWKHPVCVAGARACPPEDSGGVWGYEHLLEVVNHPRHPEHEEMLEWLGEGFDPEAFDLEAINARLRKL